MGGCCEGVIPAMQGCGGSGSLWVSGLGASASSAPFVQLSALVCARAAQSLRCQHNNSVGSTRNLDAVQLAMLTSVDSDLSVVCGLQRLCMCVA